MTHPVHRRHIYLYDSTLRDGAQTPGVDFSVHDKRRIAELLDDFGIDYIEGGWPGANLTDDAFFQQKMSTKHAKIIAFGMTRKKHILAKNDLQLQKLKKTSADGICIVGKCSAFHATHALNVTLAENKRIIADSVAFLQQDNSFILFDSEHFFDGYKQNPSYALACLDQADKADWLVLCDTNGGTLPEDIERITEQVVQRFGGTRIGIHCHNDADLATANTLAAIRAGACHIQGTFNGLGERCGNANLASIIPTLVHKMGYQCSVTPENMKQLTKLTQTIDDIINRTADPNAPYVGSRAFTHKGGLHASAVTKNPLSYEHIDPDVVGNRRAFSISHQAGRASILNKLDAWGFPKPNAEMVKKIMTEIKKREYDGYAYETAEVSLQKLIAELMLPQKDPFTILDYHVTSKKDTSATAHIAIRYDGRTITSQGHGNGPVNALDKALRRLLHPLFPRLKTLQLIDYKVRIMSQSSNTAATTRVIISYIDAAHRAWSTVGVSTNVIDASWQALMDAILWTLRDEQKPSAQRQRSTR